MNGRSPLSSFGLTPRSIYSLISGTAATSTAGFSLKRLMIIANYSVKRVMSWIFEKSCLHCDLNPGLFGHGPTSNIWTNTMFLQSPQKVQVMSLA